MKIWRAQGGIQDVPQRVTVLPPPPPPPGMMPCYPQPSPFVQGPIPIGGVWQYQPVPFGPPPPYLSVAQQQVPPPPPLATQQKKKKKAAVNPWAPPKIDAKDGVSYMFDRAENHTRIQIFNKAAPIWKKKYEGENLQFKVFKVSTSFTVRMIVENTLKKSEDVCVDWAVTEVTERGNGRWIKGLTIEYNSDEAKKTLGKMGWSPKRGDSLPPVWLVVHKADMD